MSGKEKESDRPFCHVRPENGPQLQDALAYQILDNFNTFFWLTKLNFYITVWSAFPLFPCQGCLPSYWIILFSFTRDINSRSPPLTPESYPDHLYLPRLHVFLLFTFLPSYIGLFKSLFVIQIQGFIYTLVDWPRTFKFYCSRLRIGLLTRASEVKFLSGYPLFCLFCWADSCFLQFLFFGYDCYLTLAAPAWYSQFWLLECNFAVKLTFTLICLSFSLS